MTTGSRSSSATASRPMWYDSGSPAVVRRLVDAAEDEGGLAEVELRQAGDDRLVEDVPLVAGLEGAPEPGLRERAELPGVLPGPLQALVGAIDVRLLLRQIRVLRHAGSVEAPLCVKGSVKNFAVMPEGGTCHPSRHLRRFPPRRARP